jgi:hypothetical protein
MAFQHSPSRVRWAACIAAIVALGFASRLITTGLVVFDKYLGDALYATMVYAILRLFARPAASAAIWASVIMVGIEAFQLTLIPARMLASEQLLTRICARLLGVHFQFADLLAYGVGIGCIYLLDSPREAGTGLPAMRTSAMEWMLRMFSRGS